MRWLVFSLAIGPVIFIVGSYLPLPQLETPVQTGCAGWLFASFMGFVAFSGIYGDEKLQKAHKKGAYYKCMLGALGLMVAMMLAIPAIGI